MKSMATNLTAIAALVVFAVLLFGLWNMARRESSPSLSQTLMRWRVGLQFAAIVIAMLALYVTR